MSQHDSPQPLSQMDGQRWHKSAPAELRRARYQGNLEAGWLLWRDYLGKRRQPIAPGKLWPCQGNMLLWAADDALVDGDTRRLLLTLPWFLAGPSQDWSASAESWIASTEVGPLDPSGALEAIGWALAMPTAAGTLEARAWWQMLHHLVRLAREAGEMPLDGQPLVRQLLAGELGLTLAYLFPEIISCRGLAKPARTVLSAGMLELIDGEGMPGGQILGIFRPLMACWTRCQILGKEMDKGCASTKAGYQYQWAIRAALRLSRPDGSPVFSTANGHRDDGEMFAAALVHGGDEDDEAIAALALPPGRLPKEVDTGGLPSPADHSAWASVTILQPAWGANEPKLTVAYPEGDLRLELIQQQEILLDGSWTPEVRLGRELLEAESTWQELCWVSDNDVDYLELEIQMSRGVRIQRHLAMAREDRFLILADAVLDCPEGTIDYCGRLSLARNAGFGPAEETWEGFLLGQKAAALVLPLALPEWRLERAAGRLAATSQSLELRLSGSGGALFAPLFVDLKPRRMTKAFTWRRLTVAENLEIQPASVAVGYRVMIGKQQWLVYRSLTPAANRTLLGHNLATEMLVARFDRRGEVEPLIEIEGVPDEGPVGG